MNNFEQIQISGANYEVPEQKDDFRKALDEIELKNLALMLTNLSYFWATIYLLSFFTSKDVFLLIIGLYFIVFAFVSKGKYSPKYFLSHSIIIAFIALLNIIDVFFLKQSSLTGQILWTMFAVYQLFYAIRILKLYLRNKEGSPEKINNGDYLATKKLIKAIIKSKVKNEANIIEFRYGFLASRIIKFLLTKNYIISVNTINKKITVYDKNDFDLTKLKKVPLEKKYRMIAHGSGKKIKGFMTINEYEKYLGRLS